MLGWITGTFLFHVNIDSFPEVLMLMIINLLFWPCTVKFLPHTGSVK